MSSSIKSFLSKIDKFTLRGIVYASFAVIGLIVEIFVLKQARTFLLAGYGLIIFIGLVCIIVLSEKKDE